MNPWLILSPALPRTTVCRSLSAGFAAFQRGLAAPGADAAGVTDHDAGDHASQRVTGK